MGTKLTWMSSDTALEDVLVFLEVTWKFFGRTLFLFEVTLKIL